MSSFVENVNITAALLFAIDPTDIVTVAANAGNINIVAGNSANVTTVAGINTDVTTVAAHATNVDTTATNIDSVNTVATNMDGVLFTASNMASVIAAPTHASTATNMANSATSASISANNSKLTAIAQAIIATNMANSATSAAIASHNSELKAQKWAEEAHNVQVDPGQYSAKHWAAEAAFYVTSGVIVDSITSATKTWSSSKINTQIGTKENSLGNPASNGYILSSTTGGTRTWMAVPSATPTISTQTISGISGTSITANGTLSDFTGIDNSTAQVRFSWGTDTNATNGGTTSWVSQSVTGAFSASINTALLTTVVYVKAQVQDTNRPSLGVISGSIVSATTGSEVLDSDSYVYLQGTGGTGYSALNGTTVPSVTNGSIVSNEVVFSGAGKAITYSIDQQVGQNNFSAITPSFKARPYKFGIDSTSTNTTPVLTAGYSGLLTNGSKVIVADGGTDKELTITSVSGSGTAKTLDPATKGSNTTLSNGNLTSAVSVNSWVNSNAYATALTGTSGKVYAEMTVGAVGAGAILGIATVNTYQTTYFTVVSTGWGYWNTGVIEHANTDTTGLTTYTTNDTIGIAYNLDTGVVTWYKNGSLVTSATYTLTTGTAVYLACATLNGGSVTVNFGATPFTYPIPSGYSAWNNIKYTLSAFTPSLTDNPSSAYTDTNSTAIYASATAGAGKVFTVGGGSTTTSVVLTYTSGSVLANGDTISMNSGTSGANQNITFGSIVQSGSGPYTYTCTSPSPALVQVPTTAVKGSKVTPTLTGFTRATDTLTYNYAKTTLPAGIRSVAQEVSGGTADVFSTIGDTLLYTQ